MPYAIYLRKSRADIELEQKGEMETLARHEKALIELAKKLKLNITAIYKEIVSGETIAARPVMCQLIEEVENGKWEGVLVMEIERLARGDTIDQGIVARAFKIENTKIITPTKIYDPSNEFDEEYFEFGLFMSRREYKTINRRIQRGRIQSVKDGKWIGSTPPYGYDKVKIKNDKGYTLIPNKEAEIVKMVFDWYVNGIGCHAISQKLDRLKIPTRHGDLWSRATLQNMLSNPVYIGKIVWGKIIADGIHEPIIDNSIFAKVQEIRKNKYTPPVKNDLTLKNPLTGLIYCAKCGKPMTRLAISAHNPYDKIKCSNKNCPNVSAPMFLVEKELIKELRNWLEEYKVRLENSRYKTDNDKIIDKVNNNSLKNLNAELEKVEQQISKTYDLLEQGIYTAEIFTQRNTLLSEKKREINKSITDITEKIKALNNTPSISVPELERLINTYEQLSDATHKNSILKILLARIEYNKDKPNTRSGLYNANFDLTIYPCLPMPE